MCHLCLASNKVVETSSKINSSNETRANSNREKENDENTCQKRCLKWKRNWNNSRFNKLKCTRKEKEKIEFDENEMNLFFSYSNRLCRTDLNMHTTNSITFHFLDKNHNFFSHFSICSYSNFCRIYSRKLKLIVWFTIVLMELDGSCLDRWHPRKMLSCYNED